MDLDQTLLAFWKWRLRNHYSDRYRGRDLVKFPEDLRTYQKVIEETQPNVLIELGTFEGGSAMWFRDQMTVLSGRPSYVITVDTVPCDLQYGGVVILTGDLRDADMPARVAANITDGDRVMVVDDSYHTYDVTTSSLTIYSKFVTPGCYFVVEDGIVDEPELSIWPGSGGVQPAIVDFLNADVGQDFIREWREEFGLTMHQGGWLRRKS